MSHNNHVILDFQIWMLHSIGTALYCIAQPYTAFYFIVLHFTACCTALYSIAQHCTATRYGSCTAFYSIALPCTACTALLHESVPAMCSNISFLVYFFFLYLFP